MKLIIPSSFCYPGKGAHGDLPPRPECATLCHPKLRVALPAKRLTLLVGGYAQAYYQGQHHAKATLTATVQSFHEYPPDFLPLPHPSPRNQRWFKNHPWFEAEVIAELRELMRIVLA